MCRRGPVRFKVVLVQNLARTVRDGLSVTMGFAVFSSDSVGPLATPIHQHGDDVCRIRE